MNHGKHKAVRILVAGVLIYAIAQGLMWYSTPSGVTREAVSITGPKERECQGSLWLPETPPKGVMLIGHGVSCNQGVTATIAKAYASEGYASVAFDFWGHGRSLESFDWQSNPDQVLAWCNWARATYPGLPLGYLGHSMGGFAGSEAFSREPVVDAFISMGALPRKFPEVKTLVAAGQFEELFTPERAREVAAGKAEVLISPYSNHAAETWDPVLIRDMVAWMDESLGFAPTRSFPWGRFTAAMLAVLLGSGACLMIAAGGTRLLRGSSTLRKAHETSRGWSLNPYRVAGRAMGLRGYGTPPVSNSAARAMMLGLLFALLFLIPLSLLLHHDIFTSRVDHAPRAMAWGIAALVLLLPGWLDVTALERVAIRRGWQRFAVAALTRATPLVVIAVVMRALVPASAFGGMMLCILAFLLVMRSLMHAIVTRSAGDYRAGIITSAVTLGWVFMFWFPMTW
ncbi:MAG: hypothetical protein RLZZ303_2451 [Candidatus Hydrogenedentota bacterium]|jgi:pimeloyl-ACP methyl ester carboxylesterase